jgi:hypothetical protein
MSSIDIKRLIPGGIKPTDRWHRGTNDGTCSRCRKEVPERDVPLMLWANDGEDMLIYCHACLGIEPAEYDDDDRDVP